jgi:hypothetical protein
MDGAGSVSSWDELVEQVLAGLRPLADRRAAVGRLFLHGPAVGAFVEPATADQWLGRGGRPM